MKKTGFVSLPPCTARARAHTIRAVRRYSVLLVVSMVLLLAAAPRLRALTDDEKKQQFLQSQGDADSTPTPHHKKHASANATPHHRRSPTPVPEEDSQTDVTPHHKHSPTPTPDEDSQPDVTPHHKHSPTPEPDEDSQPDVTPRHKHHHAAAEVTPSRKHHHHSPTPEPTVRKHFVSQEEEEATPTPPQHSETHSPTPRMTPLPQEQPARTPAPQTYVPYQAPLIPTPIPYSVPKPTPAPTPPPSYSSSAQVNIEKEGLEQQGGFEPPPLPPPSHHHWWQIFGGEDEHQYFFLTKSVRDAIDRAPVARHRWRFIVVHNSGTRQGNARIFDYYHRYVRKMPNGLAYQFVIGNGTSSGNGQIEVGNRWVRQIQGGHVHSDYLNNISLGICLVGDFNRDLPTKEQLEALDELIRYLRIRVGKIDGKPAIVKAHREINPPQWPTDCPGDRFPYRWLHDRFD